MTHTQLDSSTVAQVGKSRLLAIVCVHMCIRRAPRACVRVLQEKFGNGRMRGIEIGVVCLCVLCCVECWCSGGRPWFHGLDGRVFVRHACRPCGRVPAPGVPVALGTHSAVLRTGLLRQALMITDRNPNAFVFCFLLLAIDMDSAPHATIQVVEKTQTGLHIYICLLYTSDAADE